MEYIKLLASPHGGNPAPEVDAKHIPRDPAEAIGCVYRAVPYRGEELSRGLADSRSRILTSMTGDAPQGRPERNACLAQQLNKDSGRNLCVALLCGPETTGDAMNHQINRASLRLNQVRDDEGRIALFGDDNHLVSVEQLEAMGLVGSKVPDSHLAHRRRVEEAAHSARFIGSCNSSRLPDIVAIRPAHGQAQATRQRLPLSCVPLPTRQERGTSCRSCPESAGQMKAPKK